MLDKRAVFVNTTSQTIVRVITLVFTLISIKLLTNYLGITGVGEFNTITTYINLFIVIADLGLFSVTVREIAKKPDDEKKIISNVFFIRLVSALLACVLAVGIVYFTDYNEHIKLGVLIACGFLFFNLLASVYDMVLQYRLKMQYSALAEFIGKLLNIVALYVIIRLNGNFYWIVSTIALWGFLIFLFKFLFSSRFIRFSPVRDQKITTWILGISWPLGLVFIVNNLFFKLDTLMLFAIKGAEPVGIYTVAFKILEVTAFIGSFFASALKPAFAAHIDNDKTYLKGVINKSISVMLLVSLPITMVCVIFAKEIIIFISNPEFVSGAGALIFLAFTLPFIYLVTLLSEILIANDSRRTMIGISVFILLFNFLANLYFIPKYSFMGAAFTTLLSEIILLIIYAHYTRKIIPFSFDVAGIVKLVLVFIVTLIVAVLLASTGLNFLILIAACFGVYALIAYAFRVFGKDTVLNILKRQA